MEHGACIFATTLSDHETAAEKCEEDEEGFDGCSEYLYSQYTDFERLVKCLLNLGEFIEQFQALYPRRRCPREARDNEQRPGVRGV